MRRIFHVLVAAVCLIAPAIAQDQEQIIDLTSKAAKVSRGGNGERLTAPSNSRRPDIVSEFLRSKHGHDDATAASVVVESENETGRGAVHVRLRQQLAGLDVYGTYVKATLTTEGEVVSVVENLANAGAPVLPAQIDYSDALNAVLERHYPRQPGQLREIASSENKVTFGRDARFYQDPIVTRVGVPLKNGRIRVGYLVETWDVENQLWHTVVGGNGRILFEELRTAGDSYNVFANHPGVTPQALTFGPGLGNAESPAGWITANTTIGNNVDAYLDRDNNNAADTGGRPVGSGSAGQDFLTAANLTLAPTTTSNQMVAVANLFYLNNVLHDTLYQHGFTEAAGNFQTNNFGNGGFGNDSVRAEAQDGGGTNNANFATPSDGSRPRMQMYLWNTASPQRDGDVDSDIVYHEYGHGLTWRMIGGMSGKLAGAIGEGMSDTVALFINGDDAVAEYSNNRAAGIRRFRYTNYPNTYSDVTGTSVHNDGEIYAATMWNLRQRWLASGRTQGLLWDYVIDGMNFTPSTPAYEDMRDGILAAMPTQAEDCIVWAAFAKFGIGVGADGRVSPTFGITESFAEPSACSTPTNTAPNVSISAPATGSSFEQGALVTFAGSATDEDGNLTAGLSWTTNNPAGPIGSGATFGRTDLAVGSHTITASVNDSGGLTGSASITITITSAPPTPEITLTTQGYKVKGVQRADLNWTGSTNVDVFRNNSKVATAVLGSSYTDVIGGRGSGTFAYKVCQAGSTTNCSNTSTVVF